MAFFVVVFFVPLILGILAVVVYQTFFGRRARRFGHDSISAYVRAVPSTDAERRDAVDLALKGGVICVLGLGFPPLLLVGLVPLFYGARKLMLASMGLGLVDDGESGA